MQNPLEAGINGNSGRSAVVVEMVENVPGVVGEVGWAVLYAIDIRRHFSSLQNRVKVG